MVEFGDFASSLLHRRSNPYEAARFHPFHSARYDRPADPAPRRDPYYPVAAGASSDAPPGLRRSTPYEPARLHHTPYDRPADALPRRDPYYPVAAGASSDAAPPYYPVATGASSDATPRLSTNAPRHSPCNDSEFPTIGPLFLPNNLDSVRPSKAPRPRRRPFDFTIIGPIPAGAAYYGVIDSSKYDLNGSSVSAALLDCGKSICPICNAKGYHSPANCPYMVVATQLEIFRSRPPNSLRFQHYFVEGREGLHGCGMGRYAPPRREDAERASADAVRLHKDGLNLVRITNLPEDIKPEPLYKLFDKFGPVTNAIIFIDQSFGFVNFAREEDAEEAIKVLNSCGFGHLMWASQRPQ